MESFVQDSVHLFHMGPCKLDVVLPSWRYGILSVVIIWPLLYFCDSIRYDDGDDEDGGIENVNWRVGFTFCL